MNRAHALSRDKTGDRTKGPTMARELHAKLRSVKIKMIGLLSLSFIQNENKIIIIPLFGEKPCE